MFPLVEFIRDLIYFGQHGLLLSVEFQGRGSWLVTIGSANCIKPMTHVYLLDE